MCLGAYAVTKYHFGKEIPADKMSLLLKVYWALWNQSAALCLIVSAVYWLMIYDNTEITIGEILVHITNSIVLMIDLFIVKHPPRYSNYIFLAAFDFCYVSSTLIFQLFGGLNK